MFEPSYQYICQHFLASSSKQHSIIASFTIEHPDNINEEINEEQSNLKKPLTGILTNYGYALPDPFVSDRKSIWFTGGTIEPADDDEESVKEWKKIFVAHSIDNANTEEKEKVVDSPTAGDTKEVEAEEKKEVVDSPKDGGDTKEEGTATSAETEKARHLASKIFLGAVSEPMQDDGTIGFHLIRPIGGHGHAYCDLLYIDDEIRVMRGHSGSVYVLRKEVMGE